MKSLNWKKISRDPSIDWIFMLTVGLAVVTIVIAVGIFSYIDVGQATSSISDLTATSRPLPIINAKELKRVVSKINSKIDAGAGTIVVHGDPSL